MTVQELRRWLSCRKGASLKGLKSELVERVKLYLKHGWDKQYLVNPDKHTRKVYNTETVSSPFVYSLLDNPPPAGYSNSLTGIPDIDDSDIFQYFFIKCDGTDSTAVKHRDKGWNFYKSGKERFAEFKMDIDDTTLLIRGDVEASFDRAVITGKVKKKYPVHIVCNKHCGTICGARGVCKAGLGRFCKHVAAVLFFVMDHQRKGETIISRTAASTSALQTWHQPKVQGQACIKFSNINFESFNYERDNERTVKRAKINFQEYDSCPDGKNCVSSGKIEKFANELSSLGVAAHFVDILRANKFDPVHEIQPSQENNDVNVNEEQGQEPTSDDLPIHHVPTIDTSVDTFLSELSAEEREFYEERVHITTIEQQKQIANATIGQAANTRWFAERKLRLTASKFKEVACRKRFPCDKLVQRLTSHQTFSNKHTEWGKQAEPIALAQYKTKEQEGFSVFGRDLGLVVNPHFPYLAASPDWFTELKKGSQTECGLVEIKSLSKYASLKPSEAAEFSGFFTYENGKLQIDNSHSYYQIQGQVAVCGVDWCDLVVWTPKGISSSDIQRIKRDTSFW